MCWTDFPPGAPPSEVLSIGESLVNHSDSDANFCGASFCFMSWCLILLCCWRFMYVFHIFS